MTKCLDNVAVALPASVPAPSSAPTPSKVESRRRLEQFAPVIVDLILEAGVSCRIGTRLALEHDRATVRHDQPGPDQEHARLPEGDLAIIDPDQPRALGNQAEPDRSAYQRRFQSPAR